MIDVIATRRTNLNGTLYQKGDPVPMTAAQFTELEPTGRFERAPKKAEKPAPSKSSASAD